MLERTRLQPLRTATLALLALVLLAGCQQAPPPESAEFSRPAEIFQVGAGAATSGLRFPGRVRAVQRAELAFNVPGQLVELPVREGQKLAAGDLIARLDPATFEVRLASARAEFEKAEVDYERVRKIWEQSQAVAEAEVDQKRTAMEFARASFDTARKDLEDTRMTAPFAGTVTKRHVENFSNVQAKQVVVSLQNPQELEIVINVPERVVRNESRRAAGYATFEGVADRRIPVTLKAFSAEADPQTQTYEAVLALEKTSGLTILPGMSAEVFALAGEDASDAVVAIPLKAVFAGPDAKPHVWVVDPETSRVSQRAVETGAVQGGDILVTAGLTAGERIVTAGVSQLREGMLVRPL
jgi:RND family efflux transporter MFP subunit